MTAEQIRNAPAVRSLAQLAPEGGRVFLYGSVVNGGFRSDSDVDVGIEFPLHMSDRQARAHCEAIMAKGLKIDGRALDVRPFRKVRGQLRFLGDR